MALKTINDTNLSAIAAAIREKNQTTTTYKPSEMADAIKAIPAGGSKYQHVGFATIRNATGYAQNYLDLPDVITSVDQIYVITTTPNLYDDSRLIIINNADIFQHPLCTYSANNTSLVLVDGTVALSGDPIDLTVANNRVAVTYTTGSPFKVFDSSSSYLIAYGYN